MSQLTMKHPHDRDGKFQGPDEMHQVRYGLDTTSWQPWALHHGTIGC